jgi:hypothetical protein
VSSAFCLRAISDVAFASLSSSARNAAAWLSFCRLASDANSRTRRNGWAATADVSAPAAFSSRTSRSRPRVSLFAQQLGFAGDGGLTRGDLEHSRPKLYPLQHRIRDERDQAACAPHADQAADLRLEKATIVAELAVRARQIEETKELLERLREEEKTLAGQADALEGEWRRKRMTKSAHSHRISLLPKLISRLSQPQSEDCTLPHRRRKYRVVHHNKFGGLANFCSRAAAGLAGA